MNDQEIRRYQLRELAKKLTLLEGHLANFTAEGRQPICCHCSTKHAFEIEALAEEGVSVLNDLAPLMREVAAWAKEHVATFERCDLDEAVADRLVGEARAFRKQLMAAMEGAPAPVTAQPASSGVAIGAGHSSPPHLAGHNPGLLVGEDPLIIHSIAEALGAGGIVIDRERAMSRPCLRFGTDGGAIVFAKGVIGALTPEEQRELCVQGFMEATGESEAHIRERVGAFRGAAKSCREQVARIPDAAERVRAFVQCMQGELKAASAKVEFPPPSPGPVLPPAPSAPPWRPGALRRRIIHPGD